MNKSCSSNVLRLRCISSYKVTCESYSKNYQKKMNYIVRNYIKLKWNYSWKPICLTQNFKIRNKVNSKEKLWFYFKKIKVRKQIFFQFMSLFSISSTYLLSLVRLWYRDLTCDIIIAKLVIICIKNRIEFTFEIYSDILGSRSPEILGFKNMSEIHANPRSVGCG